MSIEKENRQSSSPKSRGYLLSYLKIMGELLFGKSDLSAVRPVREYLTELVNVNDGRGGADGILSVEVFHEPDLCSGAYLLHRIASKK